MLHNKLLLLLLLLIPLTAHSASSYSNDSLRKIYVEMRFLYQLGVDIHQRYDFNDRNQIGTCNAEEGYNLIRAKTLIGSTNRIEYPNKEELIEAAWAAYSCVSCRGDGEICNVIPAHLEKIKDVIEHDSSE